MIGSSRTHAADGRPKDDDVRGTVRRLYRGVDGFDITRAEEKRVYKARSSATYGEIMPTATLQMLEWLDLERRDVFVDLGCGVGKVCLMAALATPVGKVIGVELAQGRIERAREVLRTAERARLVSRRRVDLREEDILHTDLSKATVIYTCSTAFPLGFMHRLMDRLAQLGRPLTFVTTQILDEHPAFEPTACLRLDMSWRRKSKTYVYRINCARG